MSVEAPLWRALAGYRVLTSAYAIAVFSWNSDAYARPLPGAVYLAVLALWTLATLGHVSSAERCTPRFLAADLAVALTGVLITPLADTRDAVGPTLPSVWVAGAVLAFAIKGGWRWATAASLIIGAANVVERGELSRDTVHNILLVTVASIGIGYVVEVARVSERTLAEALRIEAATRERERLARDIHDSVLQVLAMVQRRGSALGGEAAELGRLAGEQEVALRSLVSGGPGPQPPASPPASPPAGRLPGPRRSPRPPSGPAPDGGPVDLRSLLAPHAGHRVTLAEPGAPVLLPPRTARAVAAAVTAALDNVRRHAGAQARAWVLLEDEPDAVLVTVRDDGPGIPAGRLAAAEAEGRMGVSLSIRGRLRELGGSAEVLTIPGQGTEVELKVPKHD
ncbi:MacS family sensor histidine kinase [Streptomyces sp. GSL17-111]|uniref:MacS family sensor histidine kinase n=1 Tax=Streptomyces sp. GSL17-111 TaxID=3121596 RepID=UPI0030F4AAA4